MDADAEREFREFVAARSAALPATDLRVALAAALRRLTPRQHAEHVIVSGGVSADRVVRLVEVPTGRVVAEKLLAPAKRRLTGAWIAPVRGTPPPGAVVL